MKRSANVHKPNALNSEPPANAGLDAAYAAAEEGCRWLLRGMLAAGQHRWEMPSAIEIACAIGLDPRVVKPGRVI